MPKRFGFGRNRGRSYLPTIELPNPLKALFPPKGAENLPKEIYVQKSHPLIDGVGRNLPNAYKRFYVELHQEPTPVHYIPKEGKYEIDPITKKTKPVINYPLPLMFPKEFDNGLWGGSAIVHAFRKKLRLSDPDPMFWVPTLKLSVVYSEVLDKYLKVVITDRTLQLIHEHFGFDHYLLQTPACDLRANLALKLKRKILLVLDKKDLPHEDPEKRAEVYASFQHYLEQYDSEFIKWYGLTLEEAVMKMEHEQQQAAGKPVPFKVKFRQELLEELKSGSTKPDSEESSSRFGSLLSKINPWKSKE